MFEVVCLFFFLSLYEASFVFPKTGYTLINKSPFKFFKFSALYGQNSEIEIISVWLTKQSKVVSHSGVTSAKFGEIQIEIICPLVVSCSSKRESSNYWAVRISSFLIPRPRIFTRVFGIPSVRPFVRSSDLPSVHPYVSQIQLIFHGRQRLFLKVKTEKPANDILTLVQWNKHIWCN